MEPSASDFDVSTPMPAVKGSLSKVSATGSGELQLPWQRFYWAIFDTREWPHPVRHLHSPAARASLDERFQTEIPLQIEQIATSYASADGTTVIACGLELPHLEHELERNPNRFSLSPAGLPPVLREKFPDFQPHQLNLLTGPHEPQPLRILRSKTRRAVLAITAAALALAAFGMFRRAWHVQRQAETLNTSMSQAAGDMTGGKRPLEVALRILEQDRDRLISTRTMQAVHGLPADASRSLAAVLSAWPSKLEVKTQTIAASAQGVTVAAEVNDQKSAEVLSQALAAIPDWTVLSPRTHATGKAVRFDASLQPKGVAR